MRGLFFGTIAPGRIRCGREEIMGRTRKMRHFPMLVASLLAGCATATSQRAADPLILYSSAYATGAYGFSCYPAQYRGGPGEPRIERMREALRDRRLRVRERLIAQYGEARIEEIERAYAEEERGVYRSPGCDLDDTARARERYRHLLQRLEGRLGLAT